MRSDKMGVSIFQYSSASLPSSLSDAERRFWIGPQSDQSKDKMFGRTSPEAVLFKRGCLGASCQEGSLKPSLRESVR